LIGFSPKSRRTSRKQLSAVYQLAQSLHQRWGGNKVHANASCCAWHRVGGIITSKEYGFGYHHKGKEIKSGVRGRREEGRGKPKQVLRETSKNILCLGRKSKVRGESSGYLGRETSRDEGERRRKVVTKCIGVFQFHDCNSIPSTFHPTNALYGNHPSNYTPCNNNKHSRKRCSSS